MIHPSPALAVRAETPIADCVQMMKDHGVGSLLIVSDDVNYTLLGIFTERDLLKRIHLIQEGSHWKKPIHTVMTHPVATIELDQLSDAPKLMVEKGIRHLPVMTTGPAGEARLAGLVSMRDFFRDWVRQRESENITLKPKGPSRDEIRIFTGDPSLLKVLQLRTSKLQQLGTLEALDESLKGKAPIPLVLDADSLAAPDLARVLKTVLAMKPRPRLLVVFDPARQVPKVLKVIQTLAEIRGVSVFKRPLNLLALSDEISGFQALARKRR
jgi:CBS domain-containing protein